ncbi:iron export ABC transporter permease subunit FetB [Streptomyces kaniharaensis]|uniref:Iron export ABC transporter permease subunit FetB n=1 Tax=Streptomyces kaniharaensis TaxID=212423 RepID=A0A6N7KXB7_9ACTN|nr:iron export ABC transporter permease subunit FetB [Streptomyces kaniharaensis]MQS16292.1 iron export ABC transporter permease subunit FetB [Streptomyces kaniharaensis]
MNPAVPTWAGVAASLALVLLAVLVAWRQRLHLARDIAIAAVRAGVQLAAVGAILVFVFRHTGLAGGVGWLALMVLIAGRVSAHRAFGMPRALPIATTAAAVGTAATLGTLLLFGVIDSQARVVIPVGGMVVSGAMQATTLVLVRLRDEARTARPAIEARLALGLPAADAFAPHLRSTLRTALIPAIDSTKTVGLISLPGAMTGLILAGVDPLTAIRYQIVVMYMLLAAAALAALTAARLAERALFDDAHRLRPLPAADPDEARR